jgi:hypothetical protein
MGGPPPLDEIPYPDWLGKPLAGGKELNTILGEIGAFATDATQVAGEASQVLDKIPDFDVPGMDPLGGAMTALVQGLTSPAQTKVGKVPVGKIVDGALAGGADVGVPALIGLALGPLGGAAVPVADFLVSKATGGRVSLGDIVNGGIRAAVVGVEGMTGREKGQAIFTAKAETGQYGPAMKFLSGLFTGRRG